MPEEIWVLCPNCQSKTRVRVLKETVLERFPLFCPKCRREHLVNLEAGAITFSKQLHTHKPDAETQS